MSLHPSHFVLLFLLNLVTASSLGVALAIHHGRVMDKEPQVVVHHERSQTLTFFKILILKPDLDYALAKEIAGIVDEAARDFDRDPDFIISIMSVESRFNPEAVSSAGAVGLMQVMPHWSKLFGHEGENLHDKRINVRRGLQIYNSYEQMLKDPELALTAYNRGSWKVEEDLRMERDPRNGYAGDVLKVYEKLKQLR